MEVVGFQDVPPAMTQLSHSLQQLRLLFMREWDTGPMVVEVLYGTREREGGGRGEVRREGGGRERGRKRGREGGGEGQREGRREGGGEIGREGGMEGGEERDTESTGITHILMFYSLSQCSPFLSLRLCHRIFYLCGSYSAQIVSQPAGLSFLS